MGGERGELDELRQPGAAPALDGWQQRVAAVQLILSVCHDDEGGQSAQASRQIVEELSGRAVGPVDILENQEQRAVVSDRAQKGHDTLEELQLRLSRIAPIRDEWPWRQLREQDRQLSRGSSETRAQGRHVGHAQVIANRLEEGQIGQRELRFSTPAPHDHESELVGAPTQLGRQARLAHAGLA